MLCNPLGLPIEYCSAEHRALSRNPDAQPLWSPSDPENTPISKYRHHVNSKFSRSLTDSFALQRWSVNSPHDFWIDLYSYCGIIPPLPPDTKTAYDSTIPLRDIPPFFPGHTLNYAENVLVPNTRATPDAVALVGIREDQLDDPENITWSELCELVRITRSAMLRQGVKRSDVVAALMANSVWVVVIFLATASIGAIFTSVSPDMGVSGCVSRFAQVSPRLLFVDMDYAVRGTRPNLRGKIQRILQTLFKSIALSTVVFVPTNHAPHIKRQCPPEVARNIRYFEYLGVSLANFISKSSPSDKMAYSRVPSSHPLVILYSSGTTGPPKCIVSPHISILNYKKIALLHNSLSSSSTVFQYSSTSWVVWNVMNGHLSVGAKLICYDGGALYPSPATLLKICSQYRVTYWGTSPRYLLELEQAAPKITPAQFDLSTLRMVTTTGATLSGTQMKWFYRAFPRVIHLSSIAGGTDIASSWIASNPAGPVYANEMQMWALGHDCDIVSSDSSSSSSNNSTIGESIARRPDLQPGELICRKPLPSMPVYFWNDANKTKYCEAYFERFPLSSSPTASNKYLDVWAQHDLTTQNPRTQGLQILGRSDGVLNPRGIRFGSAEIYAVLEAPPLNALVRDSLCVGRRRRRRQQRPLRPQSTKTTPPNNTTHREEEEGNGDAEDEEDEVVFLFIIPTTAPSKPLSADLKQQIKAAIRTELSARHVPRFIEEVSAIPYTVNGKKVEVAVKKIISGSGNANVNGAEVGGGGGSGGGGMSTIVNPECLAEYERFRDLEVDTVSETHAGRRGGQAKL